MNDKIDQILREIEEEKKIKVPVPVLKGSIKGSKTFDAPNRSSRGRTITQAFLLIWVWGNYRALRDQMTQFLRNGYLLKM